MTNKYLRRMLRSGVFFFIPTGAHEAAASAYSSPAATKLKCMQGLPNHKHGLPTKSIRASHFSCLPLHVRHSCAFLPSSSSTVPLYSSAADPEDDILSADDIQEDEKQLGRSHSCSKLHARKLQLIPSFKSLLHRGAPSSHNDPQNRHYQSQSCAKLRDFEAEMPSCSTTSGSTYTRSWSSPSLHLRQHAIKVPQKAHSFSSQISKEGSSRGRCAPKGHVAVYVEAGRERHVVPIVYLSHPLFQALLKQAEREFGFRQQGPGLHIPCSRSELYHTLHHIRNP